MTTKLLGWEAKMQVEDALVDGVDEPTLQRILDDIYGKNMFEVVDAEKFFNTVIEKKDS